MADLRLLGPYITEVLEVVGGSSLFCQFGVGGAWWPENRGFAPLYRGAEGRFSGARWFLSLTFQMRFSRVFLVTSCLVTGKTKTVLARERSAVFLKLIFPELRYKS